MQKTLKELIIGHDNDYGFDVSHVLEMFPRKFPSLSVVIPYYEGRYLELVLRHLYRALEYVRVLQKDWKFEVIVVDDGSKRKAIDCSHGYAYENLIFVTFEKNQGRTATRNAGLNKARFKKVLFMDTDVLVSEDTILSHLKVHAFKGAKQRITVGFFAFVEEAAALLSLDVVNESFVKERLNDFRLSCVYQPTWIGCEQDKEFIGKKFEIVSETKKFRDWPKSGFFGPWLLPNMVLGGFFVVDRESSLVANGFDTSFQGYGFTETSLPTKLIAGYGHFVVPVARGGCVHIEDKKTNVSREEKDRIFRMKHEYYFNDYLNLTLEEAIYGNQR